MKNLDLKIPPSLADVALVDAPTCAACAQISVSAFYEAVRTGHAPQPAFRRPRCTRWRLSDVRAWLITLAADTASTADGATVARASKAGASAAAKRKSVLKPVVGDEGTK